MKREEDGEAKKVAVSNASDLAFETANTVFDLHRNNVDLSQLVVKVEVDDGRIGRAFCV